jgi:hypothetical protein
VDDALTDVLDLKADKATTYTKTEVDTALALKANQTSVTDALALKADQSALDTTNNTLAGKQNTLTARTGLAFHEKLLENNKFESSVAGENITMTTTEDFVYISAVVPPQSYADGTGLSLINEAGQILRLLPGSGAYAIPQTTSGSVELGVITQAAKFQIPFAVIDANNTAQRRCSAMPGQISLRIFTLLERLMSVGNSLLARLAVLRSLRMHLLHGQVVPYDLVILKGVL